MVVVIASDYDRFVGVALMKRRGDRKEVAGVTAKPDLVFLMSVRAGMISRWGRALEFNFRDQKTGGVTRELFEAPRLPPTAAHP